MSDFLADGERADFSAGAFPRLVQAVDRDARSTRRKPDDIKAMVGSYARRARSGSLRGFHCAAITATSRDGLTWAAASAASALTELEPDVETVLIRDVARAGTIPEVMRFMPRRHVAAAARRSGVTRSLRLTSPWITAAIVGGAILAATGVTLLTAWNRDAASHGFTNAITWVSAVALAAAAVLSQQLGAWLKLDPTKPFIAKLAEDVDRQRGSTAYRSFVELLAANWTTVKARHVVVDTFSNVDPLTHAVLESYFHRHVNLADLPELWVVFDACEPPSNSPFVRMVELGQQRRRIPRSAANASKGARRTDLYQMLELSRAQRAELAESQGMPHRAAFRRVKDIVSADKDDLKLLLDNLVPSQTSARDAKRFAAFELLYVLAVDSTIGARNWSWSQLTSTLSPTSVQRAGVLRALLGHGGISIGQLRTDLHQIKEDFSALIDSGDPGSPETLLVNQAVGELLKTEWSERGLADPDLAHLFWGLYWFDRQSGDAIDVSMNQRAAEHLALTSLPSAYAGQLGPDLDAVLEHTLDALVGTAGACLRLCALHRIVPILQLAHDIVVEHPATIQRHARLLPRLVRDAYTVLGDDQLLQILVELEGKTGKETAADHKPISESLAALFLESIGGRHSHLDLAAARTAGGRLRALPLHANARGAWVALSLYAFTSEATPMLTSAANLAQKAVPRLGRAALEVLSSGSSAADPLARADVMTLTLTMWCWAWSGDQRRRPALPESAADAGMPDAAEFADALETAYLIAGELCTSRFGSDVVVNDLDFILDCLAEELLTVVAASALQGLARWPQAAIGPYAQRLEDVLAAALADLGLEAPDRDNEALIRSETANLIEGRLALLEVVFRRLGFVQLADLLALRSEQFTLFDYRDETTVSSGLAENMQRPGLIGVLANAVQAERVRRITELSSELVVHSARAAIAGSLGDDLTGQLCMCALRSAHSFETDYSELVEYLFAPHTRMPENSRLHRQLALIADEELNHVALWMANISLSFESKADQMMEEMRRRVEAGPDPSRLRRATELLDIYDYRRSVQLGRRPDLDAVLDLWEPRSTSGHYPYVLFLLMRQPTSGKSERLGQAVLAALRQYRLYTDATGIVMLAYEVAVKPRPEVEDDLVTETLRLAHREFETSLSAQFNLDILTVLRKRDPGRAGTYTAHIAHWVKVQLELNEQRLLPSLLEQGRWALLMLDYLSLFTSFGLPMTRDPSLDFDPHADPAGQLRRLEQQQVPEPLVSSGTRRIVNRSFYDRLVLLFEGVLRDEPAADEIRTEYDDAVRGAMPDLYRLLGDLEGVPKTIKLILDRHQRFVQDRQLKSGATAVG